MKKVKPSHAEQEALKRLRTAMNWTQSETAAFLGISKKAVESYEQGWRNVPGSIWKELLTIVAGRRGFPRGCKKCYKVLQCSPEIREHCFCGSKMDGRFCWMTASACCYRNHPELKKSPLTCLDCPVVQQFL